MEDVVYDVYKAMYIGSTTPEIKHKEEYIIALGYDTRIKCYRVRCNNIDLVYKPTKLLHNNWMSFTNVF